MMPMTCFHSGRVIGKRGWAGDLPASNGSRPAVADGNVVAVDDDGYGSFAAAHREHFFHACRVGLHIEILDFLVRIGLTGLGGVGSSSFAVNLDHGGDRIRRSRVCDPRTRMNEP